MNEEKKTIKQELIPIFEGNPFSEVISAFNIAISEFLPETSIFLRAKVLIGSKVEEKYAEHFKIIEINDDYAVENDDQLYELNDQIARINLIKKEREQERLGTHEQARDFQKQVNAFYKSGDNLLDSLDKRGRQLLTDYNNKKEAEAKRLATEQAAQAKAAIEDQEDGGVAEVHSVVQVNPQKLEGTSFVEAWSGWVPDIKDLCRDIADGKLPIGLISINQSEINKFAKMIGEESAITSIIVKCEKKPRIKAR